MSDDNDPPSDDEPEQPALQATVDAATRSGRERQSERIKREALEAEGFWRGVFASPAGRREMWKLLYGDGSTHAFNTDFAVSPVGFPDPNAAWYRRGEQDFGLRLYHRWAALDRAGVLLMHDEHDPRFPKPTDSRPRPARRKKAE